MKFLTLMMGLVICGVAFSDMAVADSASYPTPDKRVRGTTKIAPKYQKDLESILDTKFYHDPYYMNTIIGSFNDLEKEKKELANDMNLSVALEQKDANTWNSATTSMPLVITKKPTTEEIFNDPRGSYVNMIMNQEVPVLPRETMEKVSDVNKQSINDFLMMLTESGTDVGAKQVPVEYNVE